MHRDNHHSNKQNFSYSDDVSCKRHQHNDRLIDGYFHKNLEIHVCSSFAKQETNVQGNRNFHTLMMYSNSTINVSVIIGSMTAASTKNLAFHLSKSFLKTIFKHCHWRLNAVFSRINAVNLVISQKRSTIDGSQISAPLSSLGVTI